MDLKLQSQAKTNPKLGCYGARHTVALMTFLGAASLFTLRTSLSVAIISMVGSASKGSASNGSASKGQSSKQINCSEEYLNGTGNGCEISVGEFDWDRKTVGLVLGSFYYGYTATMLLGGRIVDYWGGRRPFGVCIFLSSALIVCLPFFARISPNLVICLQIMRGLIEGCGFPGIYKIITKWYPMYERSKFVPYIFSGVTLGIVVSMSVTGWLCSSTFLGGWPAVFYLFGSLGICWSILWFVLIFEDPSKHPSIQDGELKYISQGCQIPKNKLPVPWKSILTSKLVWIITLMNFGSHWMMYTIIIQLPTYLDSVLHINIKNNGLLSALPFLVSYITSIMHGYIMTFCSSHNFVSILTVRRISTITSGFFPPLLLVTLPFMSSSNPTLIICIFIMTVSLHGTGASGFLCSHGDISPKFAGTLFGLTNGCGSIAGILSPLITGFLLQYYDSPWAWKTTFLITSSITGTAATLFILFIRTDVQSWNEPTRKDETLSIPNENSA